MNQIPVRRIAATLTIGSFSVAALMGIVALLGGGDFGDGEARVLLTTLIVGSASICMLCYLATGGTPYVGVGVTGAVALVLPVTTALVLVWSDWDDVPEGLLRAFGIGVVVAVTLAQVCLLLGVAGGRRGLRVVLGATVLLAGVLAVLVTGMILEAFAGDDIWRPLGVVAILDVLGTLVTIAMAKFGGKDESAAGTNGVRVTVTGDLAIRLEQRSRATGRSAEDLVGEAVGNYLRD
jgi:hypothetical protein